VSYALAALIAVRSTARLAAPGLPRRHRARLPGLLARAAPRWDRLTPRTAAGPASRRITVRRARPRLARNRPLRTAPQLLCSWIAPAAPTAAPFPAAVREKRRANARVRTTHSSANSW